MANNNMVNPGIVLGQYQNGGNLTQRISFHDKYSTNMQGFGNWVFGNYELFEGCSILELGCGTGSFWVDRADLLPEGSMLMLSDFSSGMVEEARQSLGQIPNIRFMQIDIQEIPFGNDSFDFVIANSMLYHVPDLTKAVEEVYRVLRKSGVFYASTFGENGIIRYLNTTLKEFDPCIDRPENIAFTLQNGAAILSKCFTDIALSEYHDSREVTDTNDLLDYILNTSTMTDIAVNRQALFSFMS